MLPWPLDANVKGETIQVRDLSRGGISFTCDKAIHKGQQVVVFFSNPNGTPAAILYEAAHVKPNGPFSRTVGAKFVRMVSGAIKGLQILQCAPAAMAS